MPSIPLMRRSESTTSGARRRWPPAPSAAVDGVHGVAVRLQPDGEEPEQIRVVIDQQQFCAAFRRHAGGWFLTVASSVWSACLRSARAFSSLVGASSNDCRRSAPSCRASARCRLERSSCRTMRSFARAAAWPSRSFRRSEADMCKNPAMSRGPARPVARWRNPRPARRGSRAAASCGGFARVAPARDADAEARAGTVEDLDAALVELDVLLDDRQAQPASLDGRDRRVGSR